MILDEETNREGGVDVEELNTLGSRQLVTRDVVRLSFPPFCIPSSLPPPSAALFSFSLRSLPRDSLLKP